MTGTDSEMEAGGTGQALEKGVRDVREGRKVIK